MTDTIFARASGAGKAGVAVFRLSGPDAFRIFKELVGKQIKYRAAEMGVLRDPEDGQIIDKGLAILFEGPKSYTGEDVAEFHLHGSRAVETALYDALARLGARPAEAGEFTLRALKNGKLDLAQAEALADLIDAETILQKKQALGQLDGRLSALAEGWRAQILAVMAPLEADIDFPDEGDVPAAVAASAGPAIDALQESLITFLNQSVSARRIREGVSIAVIGAPNAGKSSLVNALAGSDVAIVSETAGTTRDIVETRLDLGGVVAAIADTAGLREATGDAIEAEGMKRARKRAEEADIRVLVMDLTTEWTGAAPSPEGAGAPSTSPKGEVDLPQAQPITSREGKVSLPHAQRPTSPLGEVEFPLGNSGEGSDLLKPGDIIVWNKADLGGVPKMEQSGFTELALSAKTGAGMAKLVEALTAKAAGGDFADGPALTRIRHVQAVEEALAALSRAESLIARAPELAAEDARLAARALGKITGAVGVEDVLGEIFSSFCIGK